MTSNVCSRAATIACFVLNTGAGVSGAPILAIDESTLTDMRMSGPTPVQDVAPWYDARGVFLDGSTRHGSLLGLKFAGNSLGWNWNEQAFFSDIRLDTGSYTADFLDIYLPAAVPWPIGRSYNARQYASSQFHSSDGYQGHNWYQTSQPQIVLVDGATDADDVIYVVYGADRFAEYKRVNGSSDAFRGVNGAAGVIEHHTGSPDTFVMHSQDGLSYTFLGFNCSNGACDGQIWKIETVGGARAFVGSSVSAQSAITAGYDSNGRIVYAVDSEGRTFDYEYATGANRLERVTVEDADGDDIGGVGYFYYGYDHAIVGSTHGAVGDLALVQVNSYRTAGSWDSDENTYYRYTDTSSHLLEVIMEPEGERQFGHWDGTGQVAYANTSDDDLAPYVSAHFDYDASNRISRAWFNGDCGCSGGVNGLHEFTYETNSSYSDGAGYDQEWCRRTTVELPASSGWVVQYFDEAGQPLSRAIATAPPAMATKWWVDRVSRNASGVITSQCTPANLSSYAHTTGAVASDTSVGLVYSYDLVGAGDLTGFCTAERWSEGLGGSEYFLTEYGLGTRSVSVGGTSLVRPLRNSERTYGERTTSSLLGDPSTQTYAYTFHGTSTAVKTLTTTHPAVSTARNGSGTATTSASYVDGDGLRRFERTTDGVVHYWSYDEGIVKTQIQDADTSQSSDFDEFASSIPTGFASTGSPYHRASTNAENAHEVGETQRADGRRLGRHAGTLASGLNFTLDYPLIEGADTTLTYHGPARYTVKNKAGVDVLSGLVAFAGGSTTQPPSAQIDRSATDPVAAVAVGTLTNEVVQVTDKTGQRVVERRVCVDRPQGSPAVYDVEAFGYDAMGRPSWHRSTAGTTEWYSYQIGQPHGKLETTTVGVSETNSTNVELRLYDGSNGLTEPVGNGHVTSVSKMVDNGLISTAREYRYTNDVFGRPVIIEAPEGPHVLIRYDNIGRQVAAGLYTSTAGLTLSTDPTSTSANRIALVETDYDERGRVWRERRHEIDPSDGSDDDFIDTLRWYDDAGRLIKTDGEELLKFDHDRIGRETHRYTLASTNDLGYADVDDVTGDVVLKQRELVYASGTDDANLMAVTVERLHDDFGLGETLGSLDSNGDASRTTVTPSDIAGRVRITAGWQDALGRYTTVADYGTNHDTANVGAFTYPTTPPTRSESVHVFTLGYDSAGRRSTVTDPAGVETRYEHDISGRLVKGVRNYVDGVPGGGTDDDHDQVIEVQYTDGLVTTVTAHESPSQSETTTYTYGTGAGAVSDPHSYIHSGHLLHKISRPDGSTTTFSYNLRSERIRKADAAGNTSEYIYDDEGRLAARVVTPATGFDNRVRRIGYTYAADGGTETVSQFADAAGTTILDQVRFSRNGWGLISSFDQDHNSAVDADAYGTSYSYEKATAGRNVVRPTSFTRPDSSTLSFGYSATGGRHDHEASRVTSVSLGASTLVGYSYVGVSRLSDLSYDEPDVFRRLHDGAGSYDGWDRFNRTVVDRWTKDLTNDVDFFNQTVKYDRVGVVTLVDDHVHTGRDAAYVSDGLRRLVETTEGTWNGTAITATTGGEDWALDLLGNWQGHRLDLDGDGAYTSADELDETRSHNAVNELTARDTDSDGATDHALVYDAVGNLVDDGDQYDYTYDALGRLRAIHNQAGALVGEYTYNGLGYRIGVHQDWDSDGDVDVNDPWFRHVYDHNWRLVATYRADDALPKERYTYHAARMSGAGSPPDALICRDRDASTAWTAAADALDERLYYCQDRLGSVVALISDAGAMKEWVDYSAYGVPTAMPAGDANSDGRCDTADLGALLAAFNNPQLYDVRSDIDLDGDVDLSDLGAYNGSYHGLSLGRGVLSNPAVRNRMGFAGYRHDESVSAICHVRNRVYHTELGRWTRRDPIGYADGMNLYEYVAGQPTVLSDPSGLMSASSFIDACRKCAVKWIDDARSIYRGGSCDFDTCMGRCAKKRGIPYDDSPGGGVRDVNHIKYPDCMRECKDPGKCLKMITDTLLTCVRCPYPFIPDSIEDLVEMDPDQLLEELMEKIRDVVEDGVKEVTEEVIEEVIDKVDDRLPSWIPLEPAYDFLEDLWEDYEDVREMLDGITDQVIDTTDRIREVFPPMDGPATPDSCSGGE